MVYVERSRSAVPDAGRPDAAGDLRTIMPPGGADRCGAHRAVRRVAAGGVQASRGSEAGAAGARPSRGAADPLQRAARRARAINRLDKPHDRVLGEPVRRSRKPAQKDGPVSKPTDEILSVVVEREIAHPPEKIWR